jgi:hypothetical protein
VQEEIQAGLVYKEYNEFLSGAGTIGVADEDRIIEGQPLLLETVRR